jgi:hypothetical protein
MSQTKSIPTLVLDLPDEAAALQVAKKIAQRTGRRIVVRNGAGELVGSADPPRIGVVKLLIGRKV